MARPLRNHPPGSTLEIVTRCIGARYLLRPSPRMMLIVQGILARALIRYRIQVHAFFYASNHYHLIVTIPDQRALARFMCYLNGNTAREAGRLVDWEARFWSRRYRSIDILDHAAQLKQFKYVLSQGCKDGLITHPTDWPGATCAHSLLDGQPVQGIWVDRTALYNARRRGKDVSEDDFTEDVEFDLTPLPALAHLTPDQYSRYVNNLLDEIAEEARIENEKEGRTPMGPGALQLVDPHDAPKSPKNSPAPRCHCEDPGYWVDFVQRKRVFMIEYREASYRYLRGEPNVVFPPDSFPPPLHFADPRAHALFPT